jgi:hypothetical protein
MWENGHRHLGELFGQDCKVDNEDRGQVPLNIFTTGPDQREFAGKCVALYTMNL